VEIAQRARARNPGRRQRTIQRYLLAEELKTVASLKLSKASWKRGHIGHLALKVDDEERLQEIRQRLVNAGASDGAITDFGAIRLVSLKDLDGLEGEVARGADKKRVLGFHERKQEA
jgi:hypothetical protein